MLKKSDIVRKALENWRNGIDAHDGICYCLFSCQADIDGNMEELVFNWHRIVADMIKPYVYVTKWLNARGIYPTESELREYRELWLEHLLNYYLSVGE